MVFTMVKKILPFRFFAFISLCVFLSACATSSFSLFPTKISSKIFASFEINPDENMRPSPLVIRIYELKSINAFNDANFFKLYDEEGATLGSDLLSREEFELSPGQGREFERKANEQSRYFAVVAAFRDIENVQWRASKALELNSNNKLIVRISQQSVTINNQ